MRISSMVFAVALGAALSLTLGAQQPPQQGGQQPPQQGGQQPPQQGQQGGQNEPPAARVQRRWSFRGQDLRRFTAVQCRRCQPRRQDHPRRVEGGRIPATSPSNVVRQRAGLSDQGRLWRAMKHPLGLDTNGDGKMTKEKDAGLHGTNSTRAALSKALRSLPATATPSACSPARAPPPLPSRSRTSATKKPPAVDRGLCVSWGCDVLQLIDSATPTPTGFSSVASSDFEMGR